MNDADLKVAFAPLEERALAMAGKPPLDRISVRDHIVAVEIGAFQSERGVTQRIQFDVVAEVLPIAGQVSDDVDLILSYDTITEAIDGALKAERLNLLETLAEDIASRLLAEAQTARVFVRIQKLDRGPNALGVEIVRDRKEIAQTAEIASVPPVLLVVLSASALGSPMLGDWMTQLISADVPVVVLAEPDFPDAAASDPEAQDHIDMLTIEQSAWRLSNFGAVTLTKTELDHAARQGDLVIWAPGKMYFDATENPPVSSRDIVGLSKWFSEQRAVSTLKIIGPARGAESYLSMDNMRLGLKV